MGAAKSSRSLSHLLMSFLSALLAAKLCVAPKNNYESPKTQGPCLSLELRTAPRSRKSSVFVCLLRLRTVLFVDAVLPLSSFISDTILISLIAEHS